ncbi:MAG: MBL fold metallo-hydrolase [Rhodospirillaceae bacterium]|nr:MBL fold metallo-hydrolase [Rhodospirillaceae bacterium]MDE0361391.1 MBL fold metallo-hydrolase [Rhodospirillaceae bacterium]
MATRQQSTTQGSWLPATCLTLALAGCGIQEDSQTDGSADPPFTIRNVTGNLYEARTASHNAVFLATTDGIIVVDPLRADFAEWLEGELAARFDSEVEYVIYSHHHPDHVAGGQVFADTAIFVGHENTAARLEGGLLPSNAALSDTDGNGLLARSEASGGYLAGFDSMDTDGDGNLSGSEINAGTHPLDVTYTEQLMLTLGDSTVELHHPSAAHSNDTTVVLFPNERAAFTVDFLHARRFPGTLSGYTVDEYEAALATVDALDFDILVPGHGNAGTKPDVRAFLGLLRDLEADVMAGIAEGLDRETLQETILLADYSDWLLYDQRRANIVGEMYDTLSAAE